jgi:plastocyanin
MGTRRGLLLALVATAALVAACSSGRKTFAPDQVVVWPRPTSGQFIVTEVDNHFHGIHPDEVNDIASNRPLVVRNEGDNLHNFTVVGTDISVDLWPGQHFSWARVGKILKPGTYLVICKYHTYVNMTGRFTVVPAP